MLREFEKKRKLSETYHQFAVIQLLMSFVFYPVVIKRVNAIKKTMQAESKPQIYLSTNKQQKKIYAVLKQNVTSAI